MKIQLSLMYNPIKKQLTEQNIKFDEKKIDLADHYLNCINELRLAKIIGNWTTRKAYKNLKRIIIDAIKL